MKTPFDIAKDLSSTKTEWNDDILKAWNTFMVHRIVSMNIDNIEMVDLIQLYFNIPEKNVHALYRNILPKSTRFYPYLKSEKTLSTDIKLISKYYGLSKRDARDYLNILSEEDLKKIRSHKSEPIFSTKKLKSNDRRKTE